MLGSWPEAANPSGSGPFRPASQLGTSLIAFPGFALARYCIRARNGSLLLVPGTAPWKGCWLANLGTTRNGCNHFGEKHTGSSTFQQQAPLINIVLSQDRFEEMIRQMSGQTESDTCCGADPPAGHESAPFDKDDLDHRCETMSGTPLRPQHVTPHLAAAVMRRHVFGADLQDLEVSKQQRLFPKHIADALKIWHRGLCATPGCPAPLHWLHTDHIQPFSHDGPTLPVNGRPYCSADNRWRGNDMGRGGAGFLKNDCPTPSLR